jgi:cytochrome b
MYVLRRVWDVPTRLFHWAVVVLVCSSWVTQHEGWMDQHVLCGYSMATLLLFRLIWGVIGSDTARFARFLKSPVAAVQHLVRLYQGEPDHEIGHNAAGGWMVLGMLGLLCVQVGTGLCANDEVSVEGPLAHVVGPRNSDWLSHIHAVNSRLIEAAIVLHLLAILTYRVLRGHRLVGPMVTGNKRLPDTLPVPRMASPAKAVGALCAAAGLVAFMVFWFGG